MQPEIILNIVSQMCTFTVDQHCFQTTQNCIPYRALKFDSDQKPKCLHYWIMHSKLWCFLSIHLRVMVNQTKYFIANPKFSENSLDISFRIHLDNNNMMSTVQNLHLKTWSAYLRAVIQLHSQVWFVKALSIIILHHILHMVHESCLTWRREKIQTSIIQFKKILKHINYNFF